MPTSSNTTSIVSCDTGSPKFVTVPLLRTQLESEQDMDSQETLKPSSLRSLLATPTRSVHRFWRRFDDTFMRPMFGGRGFVPVHPGSPMETIS